MDSATIATIRQLAQGIIDLTNPEPDFGPDVVMSRDYPGMYVHLPSKRVLTKQEVAGFLASYKPTTPDPGWNAVYDGLSHQGQALDKEEPL